MRIGSIWTIGLVCAMVAAGCATAPKAVSADRLAWFNEARFGLFIHWGIYAVPAGEWHGKTKYGEWFQQETNMPAAEYAKFALRFHPAQFNAREWVRTAKDAGMKYLVITAKHHDGFCMYDTKLTGYNVVKATPWRHDPMKDLAQACREEGIVFCFYYSLPDWHHPDFPARYSQRATTTQPGFHGQPSAKADSDKYVKYVKAQVRELLTNYGPIGIIWFDGGGAFLRKNDVRVSVMHAQEMIDFIHKIQPNCLVNNRLGLPADYGTPEQKIPGVKSNAPFEVCMTLNKHWGYNRADQEWKSSKQVVQNLADIASKGGNYLLNVGPTADGEFPPRSVEILKEVGQWMKTNGESIYNTKASPLDSPPRWGRLTTKGDRIYLHVFDWPSFGKLAVPALPSMPKQAFLLADAERKPLKLDKQGELIMVTIPTSAPDAADSVIVLQYE